MSKPDNLLRFNSRNVRVDTRVELDGADRFVVLYCSGTEVGRRRLNKLACCHSDSPCIGWVWIQPEHVKRFDLPPLVHVSICYDELEAARNTQGQ